MSSRFRALPSYHYEDNTDGIIKNSAGVLLRDYTIIGNTVAGKNLIPYPYENTTKTVNGITFTDNGDGTITADGTATATTYFIMNNDLKINTAEKYTFSGAMSSVSLVIMLFKGDTWKKNIFAIGDGTVVDFSNYSDTEFDRVSLRCVVAEGKTVSSDTVKPQLELGETATEWEPYQESYVGDKYEAKNLIPYPYASTSNTTAGVTFTDNRDGSITVNGTATADISYLLHSGAEFEKLSPGTYELSGCPAGGSAKSYYLNMKIGDESSSSYTYYTCYGSPNTVNIVSSSAGFDYLAIIIKSGTVCDNIVFNPTLSRIQYLIPITVSGVNLFDQETMLPQQGFVKQSDGSFYVENADTPRSKRLWENTEGYTGQIKVLYRFKYIKSSDEINAPGSFIVIYYNDGTQQSVFLQKNNWNANEWAEPYSGYTISNSGKTVDYIGWSYGTGSNSTWVKDIIITKDISVSGYEPYAKTKTTKIYRDAPLKLGKSISKKADNLPDIALNRFSNTITVDTTIQPASTTYQYYTY